MLEIQTKENHPIAEALVAQYGSKYFLTAEEINAIVANINSQDTKLNQLMLGIRGVLEIADPAPTIAGLYLLSETGTYTNLGGIVAPVDKENYVFFSGESFTLISRGFNGSKIPAYSELTFPVSAGIQFIWEDEESFKILMVKAGQTLLDTDVIADELEEDGKLILITGGSSSQSETIRHIDTITHKIATDGGASAAFGYDFTVVKANNTGYNSSYDCEIPKDIVAIEYYGSGGGLICPLFAEGKSGKVVVIGTDSEGVENIGNDTMVKVNLDLEDFDFTQFDRLIASSRNQTNNSVEHYLKIFYKRASVKNFDNSNLTILTELPCSAGVKEQTYKPPFAGETVTKDGVTYGWLFATTERLLAGYSYNHSTGEFKYRNIAKDLKFPKAPIDEHYTCSIGLTNSGHIIIGGLCHNSTVWIAKSVNPYDISSWQKITFDTAASYIRFFSDAAGNLCMFFRIGGAGSGDTYFRKFDEGTNNFTTAVKVIDALTEAAGSPYLQTVCVDSAGIIKVAFGFRASGSNWNSMTGVYYMQSADNGATWTKSDGTAYTLPVKKSTAERIFTINTGEGYINQSGSCLDDNNYYHTVITAEVTSGNLGFVHIWRDASGWQSAEVFDSGLVTPGSEWGFPYSRPAIYCNINGEIILLYAFKSKLWGKNLNTGITTKILDYYLGEVNYEKVDGLFKCRLHGFSPTYNTCKPSLFQSYLLI